MFGRDRRDDATVAERERTREVRHADGNGSATLAEHEGARTVRARQRDEFGGFNWGSAFFGWLVAVGMAALLTGILSGAGAAIRLTEVSEGEAEGSAETIGIAGGILMLLVLGLAYYCGGYVAGRMSRFDGARQGLGVWLFGLLATIAIGAAGALFGSEYNVLEKLDLPRIPIDEGTLATGGLVALALVVLGTLLAATFGGKVGERYHRKVDRVGFAGERA